MQVRSSLKRVVTTITIANSHGEPPKLSIHSRRAFSLSLFAKTMITRANSGDDPNPAAHLHPGQPQFRAV
jgi:hypothetical protein